MVKKSKYFEGKDAALALAKSIAEHQEDKSKSKVESRRHQAQILEKKSDRKPREPAAKNKLEAAKAVLKARKTQARKEKIKLRKSKLSGSKLNDTPVSSTNKGGKGVRKQVSFA